MRDYRTWPQLRTQGGTRERRKGVRIRLDPMLRPGMALLRPSFNPPPRLYLPISLHHLRTQLKHSFRHEGRFQVSWPLHSLILSSPSTEHPPSFLRRTLPIRHPFLLLDLRVIDLPNLQQRVCLSTFVSIFRFQSLSGAAISAVHPDRTMEPTSKRRKLTPEVSAHPSLPPAPTQSLPQEQMRSSFLLRCSNNPATICRN